MAEDTPDRADEQAARRKWVKAQRRCTAKQRIFLAKVPEHNNQLWGTQKALGYSSRTLHTWLRDSNFLEALALQNEMALLAAGRTPAEIITVIGETMDRCRQAVPVLDKFGKPLLVAGPDGNLVAAYVFDPKSVLKAAELLGKYHKLFTEKHEHELANKDGKPLQFTAKISAAIAATTDPNEAASLYQQLMNPPDDEG